MFAFLFCLLPFVQRLEFAKSHEKTSTKKKKRKKLKKFFLFFFAQTVANLSKLE